MYSKIIYTQIAKDNNTILSKYTEYSGNFKQISYLLINQMKTEHFFHGLYGNYSYYYLNESKLKLLCVTEGISREKAYDYLYEILSKFTSQYSSREITEAIENQMSHFSTIIQETSALMEEGGDSVSLRKSKLSNYDDFQGIQEEKLETFLIDFDDIKKKAIATKQRRALLNRREFRLSATFIKKVQHSQATNKYLIIFLIVALIVIIYIIVHREYIDKIDFKKIEDELIIIK